MSDDVKIPCLVCDREADGPDGPLSFCPEHVIRAGRIVARSHPLKVLLLAAMETSATDTEAAVMLNQVVGPTTISHARCLELDAMTEPERAASLAQEFGNDALRLAWLLYRYERGSWIPADYMG